LGVLSLFYWVFYWVFYWGSTHTCWEARTDLPPTYIETSRCFATSRLAHASGSHVLERTEPPRQSRRY